MTNKSLKQFLEKKLKKSFSDFLVFEEGIDISVQLEFEKDTKSFLEKNKDEISPEDAEKILYSDDVSIEAKKEVLIDLSLSGDVKAYRVIEKYKDVCDNELKKYAVLAFQKSRAHIEFELSDDSKIYISSGLGGSGNRLRYFFVISSRDKKKFSDFQKELLRKEIEFALQSNDSLVEKVNFSDYFASIVCLVPLNVSLDSILKSILNEVKNYGDFLSDEIIATNTEIFSDEKIIKIINHDPETEKELSMYAENESLDFFDLEEGGESGFFSDDYFDDDDFDDDDEYEDDDDDDFLF